MSKRDIVALGAGPATQPRKRGQDAFDPKNCETWSRQKLRMHDMWEHNPGQLPVDQHVLIDAQQHQTWQRFQRAGGLQQGVDVIAPKASGRDRKRLDSGPSLIDMLQNPKLYHAELNSKLLVAAQAYRDELAANPAGESVRKIAESLEQIHGFGWRTIQKNGTRLLNDAHFVPDIRGGKQTLAHNPQSDAFFAHIEHRLFTENPQGQKSVIDVPAYISSCWLSFYAGNSGATVPEIPKKTMDAMIARWETFAQPEPATKKAEHTAESLDDPRNVISWAAVATALLAGRPAELKGNYDDTSFMVAEEMGVKAIGYTHKQVADQMKALGRNYSFHWTGTGQMQCRMFVTGFLTTSAGKVPLCVVKFFDRQLPLQKTRIAKHYLGRLYNSCHLWWIFIRLPPLGEGSNNDEEVNRVVFRDLVLPTLEAEKLEYALEMQRLSKLQQTRASNVAAAAAPSTNQPQANVSSRSRASAASVTSQASRSHSGQRTRQLPPGNFSAEELYIRPGDNPANTNGVPFQQRQIEENADSENDCGSEDEVEDVHITDAAADLLPLNFNDTAAVVDDDVAAALPAEAAAVAAEDISGTAPPANPWIPSTARADVPLPLSEIQQQLRAIDPDGFNLRFALTLDGACPQMGSLMGMPGHSTNPDGVIHEYFAPAGNDVAKGPSACSMFGNANDCSRCHAQLKDYIKRYLKRKPHYTSALMKDFLTAIVPTLGLDPATVRTINYFCGHLEDMICKVWCPSNIKSGYVKAGLLADNESGISIDVLLGHWIGMAQLPQASFDELRNSIPLLAEESLANTTVSDASMARFERLFPIKFKQYKTERALMAWPRMRAAILVADKSKHLRNKRIINAVVAPAVAGDDDCDEPPTEHGFLQQPGKNGAPEVCLRICWCKAAGTKNARHYPNTAAGWKNHKKSAPHAKWRQAMQPGAAAEAADAGQQQRQTFYDHPYAKLCGDFLCGVADELCLSFEVAARFQMHGINDEDVGVLALMRPALYYSILGITHSNAICFAKQCEDRTLGIIASDDAALEE